MFVYVCLFGVLPFCFLRLISRHSLIKHRHPVSSLEAELAPLQIPLKNIAIATYDFAEENLLGQGGIAEVYKGLLLWSGVRIDVVIRRFHHCPGLEKEHFLKEIHSLSGLKHQYIISIVGFCDEDDEMMIVTERAVNGSLEKHLSDPTTLTWTQRLHTCVGVALVLRYIHTDIDRFGFHHDIKSSKILLNKDWDAMLFYFGFHVRYRVVFRYTTIYTDPKYIKTGRSHTHRSDAYSLGVILLEVLFGRISTIENVNQFRDKFGELYAIKIDLNLRKQTHTQSMSIFSKTAFDCLKEKRKQRPGMNEIVEKLERALELQLT